MKVLSLNARNWNRDIKKSSPYYWKRRMEEMKALIEFEKPDVLCFQEMLYPATNYIPKGYKRVGLSVSHSMWVKDIEVKKHRFFIHYEYADIFTPKYHNQIRIVNIHSHWDKDILKKNADNIFQDTKDRYSVICGDFNNTYEEIKDNTNLPLIVKSVRVEKRMPMKDTFRNFTNPDSHGEIDHFLTNIPMDYLDLRLIEDYEGRISDHCALILTIEG